MPNSTDHHPTIYDYNPIDQLSIMPSLIGKIQEYDPKSVIGILTSVKETGLFDYITSWTSYLQYIVFGIISFIVMGTVIRLIACCNLLPALSRIFNTSFTRCRRRPDHIPMIVIRAEPPRSVPVQPITGFRHR